MVVAVMLANVAYDLRLAWRSLLRSPAYFGAGLLAIALGTGASAAVYSIISTIYLHPLPFPDDDRLLVVASATIPFSASRSGRRVPDLMDYAEQHDLFVGAAGIMEGAVNLAGADRPERARAALVSRSFLRVLGIEPTLGRWFDSVDVRGSGDEVLISDGLWNRRFARSRIAVGSIIELNGRPHTIVGVLPIQMSFPSRSDIWLPLAFPFDRRRFDMFEMALNETVVVRLRSGISREAAQVRTTELAHRLAGSDSQAPRFAGTIVPLRDKLSRGSGASTTMMFVAVTVLLLIACTNVATLTLARCLSRRQEFAIRVALGGSHARLVQELMIEVALLVVIGGLIGVLLAPLTFGLLQHVLPVGISDLSELQLDTHALLGCLVAAAMTTLLSGLVPAIQVTSIDLRISSALLTTRASRDSGTRVGRALVVIQMALAIVLLAGAGLMISSLARLQSIDAGFRPDSVVVGDLALPATTYSDPPSRIRFFDHVLEELRNSPGVVSAAMTDALPWSRQILAGFPVRAEGFTEQQTGMIITHTITTGYLRTLGIPLIRGRDLEESDRIGSRPVALVNRTLAEGLWSLETAIGKLVYLQAEGQPVEIVGIVGDVRTTPGSTKSFAQLYVAANQTPMRYASVAVRSTSSAFPLDLLESAVRQTDASIPVYNMHSMREGLSDVVGLPRLQTSMLMVTGVIALVLSTIGIFSIMTYSVARRLHDYGIRLALGATQWQILKSVLSEAGLLSLAGAILGLLLSVWEGHLLANLVYDVAPNPTLPLLAATVLLIGVSILASALPALRATRVDPMASVRD